MCIAHPAKVLEIKDKNIICDFLGVAEVCVGDLCPTVEVGDYVLIHGGYAIEILDPKEAELSLEIFEELSNIDIKAEPSL
ncbi:MAG: HypC/HybG/HupF family hydrogenase formation chaperone [Abditibacteriota bacterium]|nr:HypC/HybG/HupF family hydrogenase formation chaperone [Abditibacteriota bacterium]